MYTLVATISDTINRDEHILVTGTKLYQIASEINCLVDQTIRFVYLTLCTLALLPISTCAKWCLSYKALVFGLEAMFEVIVDQSVPGLVLDALLVRGSRGSINMFSGVFRSRGAEKEFTKISKSQVKF